MVPLLLRFGGAVVWIYSRVTVQACGNAVVRRCTGAAARWHRVRQWAVGGRTVCGCAAGVWVRSARVQWCAAFRGEGVCGWPFGRLREWLS